MNVGLRNFSVPLWTIVYADLSEIDNEDTLEVLRI
jgi:hypothetical protein